MSKSILGKVLGSAGHHVQAIIITCIVLMLASTLFLAQKLLDRAKMAELNAHTARILERAVDVADQSSAILKTAKNLNTAPCSAEDLDQLRLLSFKSPFVRDVARLENGAVVCSAAWGLLNRPFVLPSHHHSIEPFRFWREINSAPIGRVLTDMTAQGSIAVATAPGAFDGVGFAEPSIKTLITTRDGAYVFRSNGIATGQLLSAFRDGSLSKLKRYVTSQCHATRAICVVESTRRCPLWSVSLPLLACLTLLGVLAGAGLGVIVSNCVNRRSSLAAQLKRAVEKNAINVVYQPIRMLGDRTLVGVEALARWSDASGRAIPPDEFIPLAEKLGLMDALTRSVLRTVFDELGDRLRADHPTFYVSVNVDSEEMIDRHFQKYLHMLRLEHRIPANRVALEVTERSTSNVGDLAIACKSIRDSGHMVMIDDFGTGYSNFAYLAALPLDAIKMDRAFTNAIGTESLASEVIPGIISVALALNVSLIIEGIETEAQEGYLKALHPTARGQGWLYGKPVRASELPIA